MAQFAGCPPWPDAGGCAGGPEFAADVGGVQGCTGPGGEHQVVIVPLFSGSAPLLVLAVLVQLEGVDGHVGEGQDAA